MELKQLLELIPDYIHVFVLNRYDETLANSATRDGIPEELNSRIIDHIEPVTDYIIDIYIA